jgi:pyrroloquinoline quinone (PQQ) biosynthesis protein C
VDDRRTLTFWEVHRRLDVDHSDNERAELERVGADDPEAVVEATGDALDAWWAFLDSVDVPAAVPA